MRVLPGVLPTVVLALPVWTSYAQPVLLGCPEVRYGAPARWG